jgi:hypothetical protein
MRKPKAFVLDATRTHGWAECQLAEDVMCMRDRVTISLIMSPTASQCRRLAAWLIKAAIWIESKEEGR